MVGVQVKSGASWFRSPQTDDDNGITGWWFYADRDHWDAWLSHSIPHLIVLQDTSTKVSYWVHVTQQSVVRTRRSAKILVPVAQTVDVGHYEELLAVATSQRPAAAWEGSAWRGAPDVSHAHTLRYAMIAPRVIAPHPNASAVEATPERCLATLVLGRISDLQPGDNFGLKGVPEMGEMAASDDPRWRLVAGLHAYLHDGDPMPLQAHIIGAPGSPEVAAGTVMAAAALLECGRPGEAAALLEPPLASDRYSTVDHLWLQAQLARAQTELGNVVEARDLALQVQTLRAEYPHDASATAIAAAAAHLIFNVSDFGDADIVDVIVAADSTATWWRTQVSAWGLGEESDQQFERWAGEEPTGSAHANLRAVSVMAGFTGDLSGWRYATSRLGRHKLLSTTPSTAADAVADALTVLRLSGDHRSLRVAVRRILNEGPASAITKSIAALKLDSSTRTTTQADLVLLTDGGDAAHESDADRHLQWLLSAVADAGGPFHRPSSPARVDAALAAIRGLVTAAPPSARRRVVDAILDLPPQVDQLLARDWHKVAAAIPTSTWTPDDAERAATVAHHHHDELRYRLLGIASQLMSTVMEALLDEAVSGNAHALAAIGDIRTINADKAAELLDLARKKIQEQQDQARSGGGFTFGVDWGWWLTILSICHPEIADWPAITNHLSNPDSHPGQLRLSVRVLGTHASEIPDQHRSAITEALQGLTQPGPTDRLERIWVSFGSDDLQDAVKWSLAAITLPDDAAPPIADLLSGDDGDRRIAAAMIAKKQDPALLPALTALAYYPEPTVRFAAAEAFGYWASHRPDAPDAVHQVIDKLLKDPGTRVARGVLAGLRDDDAALRQHRHQLLQSSSARVRTTAALLQPAPG